MQFEWVYKLGDMVASSRGVAGTVWKRDIMYEGPSKHRGFDERFCTNRVYTYIVHSDRFDEQSDPLKANKPVVTKHDAALIQVLSRMPAEGWKATYDVKTLSGAVIGCLAHKETRRIPPLHINRFIEMSNQLSLANQEVVTLQDALDSATKRRWELISTSEKTFMEIFDAGFA